MYYKREQQKTKINGKGPLTMRKQNNWRTVLRGSLQLMAETKNKVRLNKSLNIL